MRAAITPRTRLIGGAATLIIPVCILFLCRVGFVSAQQATTTGITVSPSLITLDIRKGESSGSVPISIKNNYAQTISFETAIWGVAQLHDGSLSPSAQPETAISDALSVMPRSFTLQPGKSINAQITVRDSSQLAPGGHYASVLVKQVDNTGGSLSLSPAVSVMAFIIKEDGAVRKLSASLVGGSGTMLRVPNTATVDFGNDGNVSIVPRASVQVRGPNGTIVKAGVLNQESLWVLPSSTLKTQTLLASSSRVWIPGRYTTLIIYRYDGSDETKDITTTQWVFPPLTLLSVIILVILVVMFVRWTRRFILRRRSSSRIVSLPQPNKRKSIDGIL